MSVYASVEELAAVAINGWEELAQFACRNPDVTGVLLEARYRGENTDDEQSAKDDADTALDQLENLLSAVSRYADTYLNQRYRDLVPLAQQYYENTGLPYAVAVIALGRIYGLKQDDDMRKTIKAQEDYLRDLASGKASLDYTQPTTPDEPGRMTVSSRPSAFDMTGYDS